MRLWAMPVLTRAVRTHFRVWPSKAPGGKGTRSWRTIRWAPSRRRRTLPRPERARMISAPTTRGSSESGSVIPAVCAMRTTRASIVATPLTSTHQSSSHAEAPAFEALSTERAEERRLSDAGGANDRT